MAESRETFVTPIFRGKRRFERSLPVDVLPDLLAYRDLVVEVARALFISRHPGRERVPKGFITGFRLELGPVTPGQSVETELHRVREAPGLLFVPENKPDEFDEARDLIDDLIVEAGQGRIPPAFPVELLPLFDRFGRGLADDEEVELRSPGRRTGARYTRTIRKQLILHGASSFHADTSVSGTLTGMVREPATPVVMIVLADGRTIESPYPPLMAPKLAEAMKPDFSSRIFVSGLGKFDRRDQLEKIERFGEFDLECRMRLPARLHQLGKIQDGWLDGSGKQPSAAALRLSGAVLEALARRHPSLDSAFIYPTPEGGVDAEWTIGNFEATLVFEEDGSSMVASLSGPDPHKSSEKEFFVDEREPEIEPTITEIVGFFSRAFAVNAAR